MKDIWNSFDSSVQAAIVGGIFTVIVAIIGLCKKSNSQGAAGKKVVKQSIKGNGENVVMTGVQNNYNVITRPEKNDKRKEEHE